MQDVNRQLVLLVATGVILMIRKYLFLYIFLRYINVWSTLHSTVSAQLQNTEMKGIRKTESLRLGLRSVCVESFGSHHVWSLQLIEVNYFHSGRCWCWWRRRKSSSGEKIDWKALDLQSR